MITENIFLLRKNSWGYLKREGRSSDHEVLTSRLIDRAIRPLFPSYFFNEVQVLATVYSIDKDALPAPLSLLAASIALIISKIPFMLDQLEQFKLVRIDGTWVVNPTKEELANSDVALLLQELKKVICMVEGSAVGMSEAEFVDALF